MIAKALQPLFWDTNLETLEPRTYPEYSVFRVLEYGDEHAVTWLRHTFTAAEIDRIIRHERRLSPKSANFWALIYQIPQTEVAAL
jgi:hypothetical protein